jgi:hypothetical protein
VFGLLVEPNGKVVGIDIYDGLVEQSKRSASSAAPIDPSAAERSVQIYKTTTPNYSSEISSS